MRDIGRTVLGRESRLSEQGWKIIIPRMDYGSISSLKFRWARSALRRSASAHRTDYAVLGGMVVSVVSLGKEILVRKEDSSDWPKAEAVTVSQKTAATPVCGETFGCLYICVPGGSPELRRAIQNDSERWIISQRGILKGTSPVKKAMRLIYEVFKARTVSVYKISEVSGISVPDVLYVMNSEHFAFSSDTATVL